jgi:tape measure domain-containing protein
MAIVRELVTLLRYQVDRAGLTEYAKKARTVGQQVSGVGRAAMQGWREGVNQALASYGLVPGKVIQGIREQRRLNREQRQSAKNVKEIGGGYTALAGYIRGALAYVGVTATAGLADEWSGVEARIGLATDSIEDQQRALKSLYASAQSSGQDYLATGDLFTSVSRNRKELGLGLDQSLQLTDTIGKLLTIGGGSAGSQQAALTQLGQALGSGVLRGDELNSILEQAPRLAQAVADAFGVSVGELRKLGQEGKLTSKALAEGLLKLGKDIDAEFERMPKTFGRGATLIRNAWGRMIWQLNRASAASESFYAVSKLIAENMVEIVKIGAMALLAAGVMRLLPLLRKMRGASMAALWPFLRMYAIIESIRLIGEDVLTWLRGGRSVLGGIIGRSEEWKDQIDAAKEHLKAIKDYLGGAGESLGDWVKKWGTVGILILGVGSALKSLMGPVVALGRVILMRIVAPLVGVFFAAFGWPGIIAAALVAIVGLMVAYWGDIERIIKGVWDTVTSYFSEKWTAALDWLEKKLKAILPDGWVLSGDEGQKMRDALGASDSRNPYAGRMGALQRPQSYSPNQTITNNTTINANTNNPAALANAAGQAVGRSTERAVRGYGPPMVEAPA